MAGYMGTMGTSYGGSAPPHQDLRTFGLSDKIVNRYITHAPLLGILTNKMNRRLVVDPEFKHLEDEERKFSGKLQGDSGDGAGSDAITTSLTTLAIADADDFLQPGYRIHVAKGATNQTNATARLTGEVMTISAISGDAVTVVRDTDTASNITAADDKYLNYTILSPGHHEASTAPDAIQSILGIGQQYTWITRQTVDMSGTLMGTKMYGGSRKARARSQTWDFSMRDIERQFFHSILSKDYVNGMARRTMRGIFDWMWTPTDTPADPDTSVVAYGTTGTTTYDLVLGDGTSRIYNVGGTLTLENWYDFIERAFEYGSDHKVAFCGGMFLSKFQYMMSNKVQLTPRETKWGLKVYDFEGPAGVLSMVREPAFRGGHSMDCVVLDVDKLGYAYLNVEEGAGPYSGATILKLIKDIREKDYYGAKEEVFAEVAIDLNFLKSHSWLTGITM